MCFINWFPFVYVGIISRLLLINLLFVDFFYVLYNNRLQLLDLIYKTFCTRTIVGSKRKLQQIDGYNIKSKNFYCHLNCYYISFIHSILNENNFNLFLIQIKLIERFIWSYLPILKLILNPHCVILAVSTCQ